ncbi:MAG: hypothetical protein JSU04_08710 [Bdellovibrionales bacterium]|nr:hypothetical protein [Bdellovibrionales bacterium]
MMKNLVLTIAVLIAIPALALTGSKIGVEGYVTAFDNNTITVESGNQKIEIPRKFYTYKVKAGEKIVVNMEQKDFDALIKQDTKPAKK